MSLVFREHKWWSNWFWMLISGGVRKIDLMVWDLARYNLKAILTLHEFDVTRELRISMALVGGRITIWQKER